MCQPIAVLIVRYRHLVHSAFLGAALYAMVLGVGMLLGGDDRLTGNSFRIAYQLALSVDLSPSVVWGSTLLVAGAVALVPIRKVALCGLFAASVWSTLFALSAMLSVSTHPRAAVSVIFTHTFIAVVMLGLIVVRLVDPKI